MRAVPSVDEPSPMSVHAVEDGAQRTLCDAYHVRQLTWLAPPWDDWVPMYRCRACHELMPDGRS
jgi:hypothetical protein